MDLKGLTEEQKDKIETLYEELKQEKRGDLKIILLGDSAVGKSK